MKNSYISKFHLQIIDGTLLDIGGPLLAAIGTFKFSFSKGLGRFPWGHRQNLKTCVPGEGPYLAPDTKSSKSVQPFLQTLITQPNLTHFLVKVQHS